MECNNIKEENSENNLIYGTSDVKYPYIAQYTPFILKSINNNNYDSLYLNNLFNKNNDYDNIINYDNYNINVPFILTQETQAKMNWKLVSMKCNVNNIKNIDKNNAISFDDNNISTNISNLDLSSTDALSFYIFKCNINNKIEDCIVRITIDYDKSGYNVYLIESKKWLFNENKFEDIFNHKMFDTSCGARSLLFDNS